MAPRTTRWDTTEHLGTHEERAAYLEAALEQNDPAFFQHALDLIDRAREVAGGE